MTSLQDLQKAQGAIFSESDSTPSTFNNDSTIVNQAFQEVALCDHPVALCDRTCGGLIKVSGEDRLSFIHNQTTNKINLSKIEKGQ